MNQTLAPTMLEVQNLSCGYGSLTVLEQISLQVQRGEMVGILGPNGSGKSTLLLALAGVIKPQRGRILLAGQDLARVRAKRRARLIASVPQRLQNSFPFKCLSVVLMGRYPHLSGWGGYQREDLEAALTAMEETRTLPLAERPLNQVSGGESQMVIIARALAQQAPLLLLDEATSALDIAHKIQIFNLLRHKNQQGLTLICVMHDLNLAALYCPRLLLLKQGRILADGPRDEVFRADLLSELYETDICVTQHPLTGDPQAYLVPAGPDSLGSCRPQPQSGQSCTWRQSEYC